MVSMALGGIPIAWHMAIVLVRISQCTPTARAWDTRIPAPASSQSLVHQKCSTQRCHRHSHSVSTGASGVEIVRYLTYHLSVMGIFLLGSCSYTLFLHIHWFATVD